MSDIYKYIIFLYYTERRTSLVSLLQEERGGWAGSGAPGFHACWNRTRGKQLIYKEKRMYLSDLGPGAAVTFAHYCV
jgi:hypothetical protein